MMILLEALLKDSVVSMHACIYPYSIGVTNPEHKTILQQELLRIKLLIQQLKSALLGRYASVAR